MKAIIWRELMKIGMTFHKHAPPRPGPPFFTIKIPSRISSRPGSFKLVFYVPQDYKSTPVEQRFPVVVNFHGGGFTLGTGTDDARWAKSVVETTKAVLVSVEYRLAPEYPFPVGVEDGTDAVLYLAAHADELRLDPHRIALSGFSAGGNYAFTVPLMLHDLQIGSGKRTLKREQGQAPPSSLTNQSNASASLQVGGPSIEPIASSDALPLPRKSVSPTEFEISQQIPPLTITAIVAFYPAVDFRIPRSVKKLTNPQPACNLPDILTDLFDNSYMNDGYTTVPLDFADPYLSPAAASDALLAAAYPDSIVLYTCEYDMLNAEGVAFGERLKGKGIGKTVKGGLIKGVAHAFDRKPDLYRWPVEAERCYREACAELNVVFRQEGREGVGVEERRQLEDVERVERFEDGVGDGARGDTRS